MICPYCNKEAPWVENKVKYGRNYGKSYMCYYCKPCDAYVGCHQNSREPLGTMANGELRHWRIKAHAHIDPYWRDNRIGRRHLYKLLDRKFGKTVHIGATDIEMCKQIINTDIEALIKESQV